jgi:hypothetical protein
MIEETAINGFASPRVSVLKKQLMTAAAIKATKMAEEKASDALVAAAAKGGVC